MKMKNNPKDQSLKKSSNFLKIILYKREGSPVEMGSLSLKVSQSYKSSRKIALSKINFKYFARKIVQGVYQEDFWEDN